MKAANGWRAWLVGALFLIVLALAGVVWSAQSAAIDDKVSRAEFFEFKERVIYRLDRIGNKLDRLLERDR